MFDTLSLKLQAVLRGLRGRGHLSEKDVVAACREIRLVLLEADVNFKVVKDFVNRIREHAIGEQVMESLTPGQQVVKIVRDELTSLMGSTAADLDLGGDTPVLLMVGLQGGGKTTTCGKLAHHLSAQGKRALLVATDLRRPAAVEQLRLVAEQAGVPAFVGRGSNPLAVAQAALKQARAEGLSPVIVDTAGRTHVDEELMAELAEMRRALSPREVLLVLDAMTGQDAVNVAQQFEQAVGITGVVLSKLDGDARGGAALSVRAVTGRPIKFAGVGEKLDALEAFHPDRMASRILGMGDVLTLIEKAESALEEEEAEELERRLRQKQFDLNDFMRELGRLGKLGSLEHLIGLIPGIQNLRGQVPMQVDPSRIRRLMAIVQSMTQTERSQPDIIDGSRRRRIARGSGVTRQEVNLLLKQFRQMRDMLTQIVTAEQGGRRGRGLGPPPLRL